MSDAEWAEALRLQGLKVAEEWSVYRGAEDSASIAARELAIAYLEIAQDRQTSSTVVANEGEE